MLRLVSIAALVSFTLVSCKNSDSSNDGTSTVSATDATGLVFTGNNGQEWPWSSSLYRLNPETFQIEKLLSGESSDAVVFKTETGVLLFNRAFDSQNYRLVSQTADKLSLTAGEQKLFSAGDSGDPHDIIDLGNDEVLLSNYVKGKVSVMNKVTGEKVSDVEADWDLPAGINLQPEAFWRKTVGDRTFIYVVHQAGAFEGNLYTVNGTQAIFVLEQKGQTITAVDLDPATDKVQGIKLQGSFPIAVKPEVEGEKLTLVSMCSRFVAPSALNPANVCKNAVEELDPATQTVTVLWDLDGAGFFMNGSVVSAGGDGKFMAQVEQQLGDTFSRRVVKFDAALKTSETVYDYEPESGGYYGLYFDETRKNLFIGDINTDTLGKFTVLKADGTRVVITLDGIPYSGTFVY